MRHATTTGTAVSPCINGLADGDYSVYAWHDGFLPAVQTATLTDGDGSATVTLQAGSVGQTSMDSTRLTAQQVQDLGIDPNDPDNQNVFQFEIHLAFVEGPTTQDLSFEGYTTGDGFYGASFGGGGGGGSCAGNDCGTDIGGYTVYPQVQYIGDEPTIVWMVIPGVAKWLKEFFDVRMIVSNLAGPGFTFQHGDREPERACPKV